MKNNKLITLFFLLSCFIKAEVIPSSSKFDVRMKTVSYNAENVIQVKSSSGHITSLIFADYEKIEDAFTGFSKGWELVPKNNILYLKPIVVEGANSITPNKSWNTNLVVKTNVRFYVFDLEAVPEQTKNKSYVVAFNYPTDKKIAKKIEEIKIEEQAVNKELSKLQPPKNWNYRIRVRNGSQIITPNFIYDDGINTYLGYSREKSIPSTFQLDETGKKEMIVNSSMRDYNNQFKIMVINKVKPVLILRKGDSVVGIYNKSFGKNVGEYKNTVSDKVEREIINDE